MALAALSPLVERLQSKFGLEGSLPVLEMAWQQETGTWGSSVEMAAVDNGVLVVEAKSAAAMQELSFRRKELLRRLNKHFPKPWIHNVTVRLAAYGNGR